MRRYTSTRRLYMLRSHCLLLATLSCAVLLGCSAPDPNTPSATEEEDLTQATIQRAFERSFSAGGDPDAKTTSPIELSKAPAPARRAMQTEARRIARLTTETYGAEVEGYYVVYTTPSKRTVAGYAVLAWGVGEPDYQNFLLTGFSAQGKEIFRKSEAY
jgi:hypothetical protein